MRTWAPFVVWRARYVPDRWYRATRRGVRLEDVKRFRTWEEAMGLSPVPDPEVAEPCS